MYCFAKFCRLCLEKSDRLLDYQTKDDDNISLINKIKTLMPSLIISNDKYPTLICDKCQVQLNNSYKFFKECFNTKQRLFKYNLQLNFNGDKINRDLKLILNKLEGINDEGYIKINTLNLKQTNNFHKKLNNKDKGYICKTCGKSFSQIANLECHLKDIHLKIRQNCKICKKFFTQVGSLKYHESGVHLDIRNRFCEYCEGNDEGLNGNKSGGTEKRKRKQRFRNTNLRKHLNIYKRKCRYCQHKFWSPKLLKYHLENCKYRKESATNINQDGVGNVTKTQDGVGDVTKTQDGVGNVTKTQDGVGNVTKTKDGVGNVTKNDKEGPININNNDRNVEEIILIENKNKKRPSHVCKVCGQFFPRHEYLEHHFINIHLKIKYDPFNPENCDETFTKLSSLHYLDTRKHICEFCKLRFEKKTPLKFHLKNCKCRKKITSKQKPKRRKYNCGACTKSFVSVKTLKRHIRNIHLRIRHECDICHKNFAYLDGLNYHKHVYHSEIREHKCDFCGRQFWEEAHVKRHQEICKYRREVILKDDKGVPIKINQNEIITLNENIKEELQKKPTFEEIFIDKIELKTEEIYIE